MLKAKTPAMNTDYENTAYDELEFRFWLQNQFSRRCKKNSKYSLRAFARLLRMDASSVSQILLGKRKVSIKLIKSICEILCANPTLIDKFSEQSKKRFTINSGLPPTQQQSYSLLSQDAFNMISDWYHVAILELFSIPNFEGTVSACAKALNISNTQAKIAVERLMRLDLLKSHNGKIARSKMLITNFKPGMTSSAHKLLQRQILQKALDAIDNVDSSEKDITCMTMAVDSRKLMEARELITKFRREMSRFLENGKRNKVYQLAIQLYPISKEIKELQGDE
jgi:uncharacterized protein (TIGR02147 family)